MGINKSNEKLEKICVHY